MVWVVLVRIPEVTGKGTYQIIGIYGFRLRYWIEFLIDIIRDGKYFWSI